MEFICWFECHTGVYRKNYNTGMSLCERYCVRGRNDVTFWKENASFERATT